MTHYFTDNSDLKSEPIRFDYCFDNEEFIFHSDSGVFSKEKVDYGSVVLIRNVLKHSLGTDVLDLGCGYGPVGIILKRLHPEVKMTMVDVNPRAVALSKRNAEDNHIEADIRVCDDILTLDDPFDTVVLNPPIRAGKEVIFSLYEKSFHMLKSGGNLFIVVRKSHGAASHEKYLKTLFQEVSVLDRDKGYYVYQASKK